MPHVGELHIPPESAPPSRNSCALIYKFKYPNALRDNVWVAKVAQLWLTEPPSRGGFVAAYVFLIAVPGPVRFSTTIQESLVPPCLYNPSHPVWFPHPFSVRHTPNAPSTGTEEGMIDRQSAEALRWLWAEWVGSALLGALAK